MKNKLYLAYGLSVLLIIWPIFTYFIPKLTNANFYNLIFIISLSISIYTILKNTSFTEQVNSAWLISALLIFYILRESLLLIITIFTTLSQYNFSQTTLSIAILVSYLPPLIILAVMNAIGILKLRKHQIISKFLAKELKKMITRTNSINNRKIKSHINNDFNLTVDPNDIYES